MISLRPATLADRRAVYEWMACSDLTPSMFGPPIFPEFPIPTWHEFIADYVDYFFDGSRENLGRSYIIEVNGEALGHISHSQTEVTRGWTELDIWMRSTRDCGSGYGSSALLQFGRHLNDAFGLTEFLIRPSCRNPRAIAAYRKAGFAETTLSTEERAHFGVDESHDTIVMRLRLTGGSARHVVK